jgi:hypothetical protein
MINQTHAFRLAWQYAGEFRTSEYGYAAPDAALRAVQTLNRTRLARGRAPYSHIVEYNGPELVAVKPLEVVS